MKVKAVIKNLADNYGKYMFILTDEKSNLQIPVIISELKFCEAYSASFENTKGFKHQLLHAIGAELKEIYFHSVIEGIFNAKAYVYDTLGNQIVLDISAADACIWHLASGCTIMVEKDIFDNYGHDVSAYSKNNTSSTNNEPSWETSTTSNVQSLQKKTKEEIQKELNIALSKEDYESAAKLRDELNNYD